MRKNFWKLAAGLATIGLAAFLAGCPISVDDRNADNGRAIFGAGPSAPMTITIIGLPAAATGSYAALEIWEFGMEWNANPALTDFPAARGSGRITGGSFTTVLNVPFPFPETFERISFWVEYIDGYNSAWGRIDLTDLELVSEGNVITVWDFANDFTAFEPTRQHRITLLPNGAPFAPVVIMVDDGTWWNYPISDFFDWPGMNVASPGQWRNNADGTTFSGDHVYRNITLSVPGWEVDPLYGIPRYTVSFVDMVGSNQPVVWLNLLEGTSAWIPYYGWLSTYFYPLWTAPYGQFLAGWRISGAGTLYTPGSTSSPIYADTTFEAYWVPTTLFDLATAYSIPAGWEGSGAAELYLDHANSQIQVTDRSAGWNGLDIPLDFFTGGSVYTITVSGFIGNGGTDNVQSLRFQLGRNPHNGGLPQAFSGFYNEDGTDVTGSVHYFANISIGFTEQERLDAVGGVIGDVAQTHVRLQLSDGEWESPQHIGPDVGTADFTITALTITRLAP